MNEVIARRLNNLGARLLEVLDSLPGLSSPNGGKIGYTEDLLYARYRAQEALFADSWVTTEDPAVSTANLVEALQALVKVGSVMMRISQQGNLPKVHAVITQEGTVRNRTKVPLVQTLQAMASTPAPPQATTPIDSRDMGEPFIGTTEQPTEEKEDPKDSVLCYMPPLNAISYGILGNAKDAASYAIEWQKNRQVMEELEHRRCREEAVAQAMKERAILEQKIMQHLRLYRGGFSRKNFIDLFELDYEEKERCAAQVNSVVDKLLGDGAIAQRGANVMLTRFTRTSSLPMVSEGAVLSHLRKADGGQTLKDLWDHFRPSMTARTLYTQLQHHLEELNRAHRVVTIIRGGEAAYFTTAEYNRQSGEAEGAKAISEFVDALKKDLDGLAHNQSIEVPMEPAESSSAKGAAESGGQEKA